MRIFRRQQNIIETSPVVDAITGNTHDDLDITFNLYDLQDVLVTGGTATLANVGGGVYRATVPVLSTLQSLDYQAELIVKLGGITVWYFKGLCPAIIRSSF